MVAYFLLFGIGLALGYMLAPAQIIHFGPAEDLDFMEEASGEKEYN